MKYLEYDEYNKYKYYKSEAHPYQRLNEKLHGRLFDCPNCGMRSGVKVYADRDLFKDTYFIRAFCLFCNVDDIMQVSSFALENALENADIDIISDMINDTLYSLAKKIGKDTSEFDLDAMIDKDWELAGG